MRLQKFLSRAGVASRREAEGWMQEGRVRVNGEVVRTPGARVDPDHDRVEVDGARVRIPEPVWILLHKPDGTLTTRSDPGGRPTVFDLLPPEMEGLSYVGRLDMDTEGLLLLTNEGGMVHALTHPSSEVEREYRAEVEGVPDERVLRRLEKGVQLGDGPARATRARIEERGGGRTVLSLVLTEGRNREVRRLCRAVGHPVLHLRRVRFGPLELGDLPPGEWRELTDAELARLRERVGREAE